MFEDYLKEHTAPSTSKRYLRAVQLFQISFENRNIDPKKATFSELLAYLHTRRLEFKNASSVGCVFHAIKHYYCYLIATNQRQDNPAESILLRDKSNRDIQLQDLFSAKELELILDRKERYKVLKNRNLLIISLLIYQGLKNGEIKNLNLQDIDFREASVYVKGDLKTNPRSLKLHANQVVFLMQYLNEERPKLLKNEHSLDNEITNKLIVSKLGTVENGEGINYLIESSKYMFPKKNLNPKTIRQSVITNLLKEGKDLRLVQVFSGHKTPSTTEKYKQTHLENLKKQLLVFHPMSSIL